MTLVRYIVMVKPPDDHPGAVRLFGVFGNKDKAEYQAARINEAIEKHEAREFEKSGGIPDESTGWAYVLPIRKPSIIEGRKWGKRGEA